MSIETHDPKMDTEENLFYFETDHLALRGNREYSEVLKNLLVLCAQRKQAIKDYSKAVELKKEALEDPTKVLEKIIKGESLGMPDMHVLPEIPAIDWSKFEARIPEENLKEIYSNNSDSPKKKHDLPKKNLKISTTKWTAEEQKRLEELLQTYPPEPIEMRRFKKIADALGNRTIQQVTSRLQKYFLKLYKAGLPVPGRIPKSAERFKKSSLHKHQRHNHYLWKPTTFFPDLCVPVDMDDLDNVGVPSSTSTSTSNPNSNYLMPSNYHTEVDQQSQRSDSELKLELLKRVKAAKAVNEENFGSLYQHKSYKCAYCGEESIAGIRWHCDTCKPISVDFCTDCVLSQLQSENCHSLSHNLTAHSEKESDDFSDSGSRSENQNPESFSSSDYEAQDEEMFSEADQTKNDLQTNGVSKAGDDDHSKNEVEYNMNLFEVPDTELFNESQDVLFSDVENVSYDYLHSSLMLDMD